MATSASRRCACPCPRLSTGAASRVSWTSRCPSLRPRRWVCRATPSVRWPPRSDCEPQVLGLLAANPLLTIMLVVSLGTLLGAVPSGPVRFGAAGALFVGLGVGALDPRLGTRLGLVQTLGLALFVYMVGIAVGARFFRGLRRQLPLMAGAVVVLGVAALAVVALGSLLDISPTVRGGVYAGALTSTPALAAAIT